MLHSVVNDGILLNILNVKHGVIYRLNLNKSLISAPFRFSANKLLDRIIDLLQLQVYVHSVQSNCVISVL